MCPTLLIASLVFAAPTYSDVAPILQSKCCACHQKGQAAPMALGSCDEATHWSDSIREALVGGRMPPWHADPSIGRWANDRSLTAAERETLLAWLDAGCPEGTPRAAVSPPATSCWRIKPDVVITIPSEQRVPSSGTIPYRLLAAQTDFEGDRWVQAAEIRPGNPKAVHHVLVFCVPADKGITIENGMVASYLPGDEPMVLPDGYAKRLPAGQPLFFQIHYVATGEPEADRTCIGLVFAKEPPKHEVHTVNVEHFDFTIPPGASNHEVRASHALLGDVELLSLTPHMHLRGKDFSYAAEPGGSAAETLLSVPRYDFNWQTTYRLAAPLKLPAGATVSCVAHYDNSSANPANPDATQAVHRGEQTTDEMMLGFVEYAVASSATPHTSPRPLWLVAPITGVAGLAVLLVRYLRRLS